MDFQTQFRQHGYKFVTPEVKQPTHSYKDMYRERTPHVFSTPRVQVHDCRPEVTQAFSDPHLWEAWLLKQGMNSTHHQTVALHSKDYGKDNPNETGLKVQQKLLCKIGKKGKAKGSFNYPRGLTVTDSGDIWIADTMNHRLQLFNQCGVFKTCWGTKGAMPGEMDQPTGVVCMINGDLVVTDRKNKRVQVFTSEGRVLFCFGTVDEPFSVACDENYNIVIGSVNHTIEVYRRGGKLLNTFSLENTEEKCAIWLACNNKNEVIVSDPADGQIKFYTYGGKLVYQFKPACGEGLSCLPGGICVNPLGEILVADTMNHTVNVYSERGVLLQQLVGPTDDAGAVQNCAVGLEGHLVVTEFTANGPHCVKLFRYGDCECHKARPGSSKKRTPEQD